MRDVREHFDAGSLLVIFITLLLFGIALVEKGFTHDMLLEAGVFLISVKLILIGVQEQQAGRVRPVETRQGARGDGEAGRASARPRRSGCFAG